MAVQISADLQAKLLQGRTFSQILDGGRIEVYSGTMPLDPAVAPPTANLLGEIRATDNAYPSYENTGSSVNLVSSKVWKLKPSAVGTVGFLRIVGTGSNSNSVILTDQTSVPEITSVTAAIEITLFYITFSGQG